MPLEFRPKLDKIIETLLYLATVRPDADKYQAVKFLYLADREHLLRYGRPITYEVYYALPFGPVASTAMDLLNGSEMTMKRAGIESLPFNVENVQRPGRAPLLYLREPLRDVDFDLFSKSDIRVFDEVLQKYGSMTFDELYQLTHDHYAYKKAWKNRGGANASPMSYEDMIESSDLRKQIVEDIGPVSARM
jgi:uncharacterized phage-associated protein